MHRLLPLLALLLLPLAARAQLINGDFEQARPAVTPPSPEWTLKGPVLPEGWNFNTQYGGPVGLVSEAHGGKYALSLAAAKSTSHVLQGPFPVKPGDCFELSAWARDGRVELTFYEFAAENRWLRTVPAVASISAGDRWVQGGGYYTVADPQVQALAVVVAVNDARGALVDDLALRRIERAGASGPEVVLETSGCRLVLDGSGAAKSFYDKTLQEERLATPGMPLLRATVGAWTLPVTALRRQGADLVATFGEEKAEATIACDLKPYFLGLRLKSSRPQLAGVTLVDLTLKQLKRFGDVIGCNYDERAAVGVQALHYSGLGTARAVVPGGANLACSFTRFGVQRAGCALLCCPRPRLAQTIEEIEAAYGLPSPHLDGKWGKHSALVNRSYFFVTDLSEANVDEVIRYGKRGHFGYMLILENAWSNGGGSFAINERNFPHGLAGLKATIARLHAAGFKVGLHVLSAGMRPSDPLVTPVPDPGIYVDVEVALAQAVDEKTDFIPLSRPPQGFSTEDGYEGHGMYVRLGDEIISYGNVKLDPPYGLVNCRRGALDSKAAAHQPGDSVRHLYMSYGLFLIDADSPLMNRVAANAARAVNTCGCDGFYFDGAERLQGDHTYYNARIMEAYYSQFTRKDMLLQGSSFSHYSWHLVSREASADGFSHIKEYLDKRTPSFQWYFNNLMPLDIGWYAINPNIRPDDIEYVCSRAVGFSSSISIETGVANLNSVPQAPEIIDMIARWEDLRLSGRVGPALREKLQEVGKEYHLDALNNREVLIPVEYSAWADGTEGQPALKVSNTRKAPAQVELQIECGQAVRPGAAYEQGQPLELFESELPAGGNEALGTSLYNPSTHGSRATRAGVTQELSIITDDVKEGKAACRFTAVSTLKDNGGWATFGKAFAEPLDLKNYGLIGLWVKGDGKGELLKVQLWDTAGKPQDQYLPIDFEGWRFIELPRPKPDVIDTSHVARINFYYNGIPAETSVSTIIDGVKVMAQPTLMENPAVRVNGERLLFPLTMRPGDRLLYRTAQDCWLYPVGGEKRRVKPEGTVAALSGEAEVTAEPATHQLLLRAALLWPTLALPVQ